MKTLKILGTALAINFLGLISTYACEVHEQIAVLETAQKEMTAKATDDTAKAKAAELAKQIDLIKEETAKKEFDKDKLCNRIKEIKKTYGVQ